MPSPQPSPSNGYAIPRDFVLSQLHLQGLLSSLHERLEVCEDRAATFDDLISQGTGQALSVIQANVGPQLTQLQAAIADALQDVASAQASVQQLLNGNLSADSVTQTVNRRFVPAYAGATRRMLLSSSAGLEFLINVAVDAQGLVDIDALRVPWAKVTGKPSAFTPAVHGHGITDVLNLQNALDGKEPAIAATADPTTKFWRGDKQFRPISEIQPAFASGAEASAGTEAEKVLSPSGLRAGLNATGAAPVFAARAACWFTAASADLTATYNRPSGSNVVTVTTSVAHAMRVGHLFLAQGPSGGLAGIVYEVATVISATQFTFVSGATTAASGAFTIPRRTLDGARNVAVVNQLGAVASTIEYFFGFAADMPSAAYIAQAAMLAAAAVTSVAMTRSVSGVRVTFNTDTASPGSLIVL